MGIIKCARSSKRLVVEQKGLKFGPQREVLNVYCVLLTVKFPTSACTVVLYISDFLHVNNLIY